jgi:hypothetical protein
MTWIAPPPAPPDEQDFGYTPKAQRLFDFTLLAICLIAGTIIFFAGFSVGKFYR